MKKLPKNTTLINEIKEDQLSLIQKLRSWFETLSKYREPFKLDWVDIARYIFPRREYMSLSDTPGQRIGKYDYSGWAVIALNMLVNGFQGHLVSPSIKWFVLRYESTELQKIKAAKIWLEDVEHYFYEIFETTNFYSAVHEYVQDAASIATATLYSEENQKKGKPSFNVRHPLEIYISENRYGDVDTVVRRFKLQAREAVKIFGKEKLSTDIQRSAEKTDSMNKEFKFLHFVFPNEDRIDGKIDSINKPFISIYIEAEASSNRNDQVLRISGYNENPYCVWRWDKNSTEWYGRGPAHDALIDVIGLSHLRKNMLRATDISVKPPMMAPAEHRGRIRIIPGGMNYYENLSNEEIKPIMTGINFPVGVDRERDLREIINKHFMVDFFLLLAQAEHQMTATEILEKQGEKAAILGTTIGKFEQEGMDPLFDRLYRMEYEAERLPQIPEELMEYAGSGIRVDYVGPLAQIQRRVFKARGALHSIAALQPILEIYREGMDVIDFDVVIKDILETHGMPERAIREEDAVEAIREMRAQAEQQQQALEQQREVAETASKITKKVEPGSVLEEIIEGGATRE